MITWARHPLGNREFIFDGATQPDTEPSHAGGLDGMATAEERGNYHWDILRVRKLARKPGITPPAPPAAAARE